MKDSTKLVIIGLGVAAGVTGLVIAFTRKRGGYQPLLAEPPPDVADRIGLLQDAVWDAVRNPEMRELALAVTGNGQRHVNVGGRSMVVTGLGCPARDGRCEADAVGRWVNANAAISPVATPAGDDSPTALACSLLSLNGIACHLGVARNEGEAPRIYPVAGQPKNWPNGWDAVDVGLAGYSYGTELPANRKDDYPG